MRYKSTGGKVAGVTPTAAVLEGLAGDGGLFVPETFPTLPDDLRAEINEKANANRSWIELATAAAEPFFSPDIPRTDLARIVKETCDFPVPLIPVTDRISVLELFHGPTLAFKDFGARFLARAVAQLRGDRPLTVLVATSGDTGSAVAHGFYGVEGVSVVILYPSGKVSKLQEQQLTTLGGNISALEVLGTFDDCQRLVKQAFLDTDLAKELGLISANSINIGRLIPQTFYYFSCLAQLHNSSANKSAPVAISVPSGNLGNLTAGMYTKRLGLKIDHFISATNINDIFPQFLKSGILSPRPSQFTASNAMDIGNPSNIARLNHFFSDDLGAMRREITGESITDEETLVTISRVYNDHGYTLDPHTAVGWLALERYLDKNRAHQGIVLSTAHPAKFVDVVEKATSSAVAIPERLAECAKKTKLAKTLEPNFDALKMALVG